MKVETYTSVVVVLSVALLLVAASALASGAALPPARHRIAARDGQVCEVPEREVSEA